MAIKDWEGNYINEKFQEKKDKLNKSQLQEINSLRFQKAIAELAKLIYIKDDKRLNIEDFREIGRKVYNDESKLKAIKLKRMMSQEIVKQQINNKLQDIYINGGLNVDSELIDLYNKAKKAAEEKKDGSIFIKLMDKIENAFSLQPSTIKTSRSIDFSEDKLTLKESKETKESESE